MKDWNPTGMKQKLVDTRARITKARVQAGGDGVVAVFMTQRGERFTYQMPSVIAAKTAVMMLAQSDPELFPVQLSSESFTRAVFKQRTTQEVSNGTQS